MSQFVGQPEVKVIIRKKQYQWVVPAMLDFDIDITTLIGEYSTYSSNIRDSNIDIEPEVGAAFIQPLYINRNNYIVGASTEPEPAAFTAEVPRGAPPESKEEIQKRVFVAIPTMHQAIHAIQQKANKSPQVAGDFVLPGSPLPRPYDGPIWTEVQHEQIPADPSTTPPPVTWCHQTSSSSNVEWFIHQKYGNFTNESFWIDIYKNCSVTQGNVDDVKAGAPDRFIRYGKDNKIMSYIAFRLGWENPEIFDYNLAPKNIENSYMGPYDVIFPIGGAPFIYDHQGDSQEESYSPFYIPTDPNVPQSKFHGYVASQMRDPSWVLTDDCEYFRLYFFVLRGKLIIRSNYASIPWVFPDDYSSRANSETRKRYENFYIPAGKVCIMGRGIKFRFNFNPLEFNIYQDVEKVIDDTTGLEGEQAMERVPHGSLVTFPMAERDFGGSYGWRDLTGVSSSSNFTVIPIDKDTTDPTSGDNMAFGYGFDVITDGGMYDGIKSPSSGYTSMMIGVDGTDPNSQSIKELVNTYFRPPNKSEDSSPTTIIDYGFQTSVHGHVMFKNKYLQIDVNCKAPTIGPNTTNISKRFASPVLWRLKGHHTVKSVSIPPELNITNLVKKISFDTSAPDLQSVRQSFTVEVILPKDYNLNNFGFGNMTRAQLIEWLQGPLLEIEIWIGYWGAGLTTDPAMVSLPIPFYDSEITSRGGKIVKVFTGIAMGGPLQETYAEDVISLQCKDKLEILASYPILNSPFYDGMMLSKAFYHLGGSFGLPTNMFRVRSHWSRYRFLPIGYTFQEPRMRFAEGTTIFDAMKNMIKMYWHVLRTDPDGTIVLTDLYSDYDDLALYIKTMEELNLTHPSYVFYVDGSLSPNPFQRAYEVFSTDKNTLDHMTEISIMSVDRVQGAIIMDGTAMDVAAIEDPTSKNFIGFRKPLRYREPALGDEEHIINFRNTMAKHVFQSPIQVKFHTFGRPTLRPLDIIQVVHSEPQTLPDNPTSVKYRIISVGGTVEVSDKWRFRQDIVAEHM